MCAAIILPVNLKTVLNDKKKLCLETFIKNKCFQGFVGKSDPRNPRTPIPHKQQ